MSNSIHIAEYDSVIRDVLESGGEFRMYPHGTSMRPLIRQGIDSVVLEKMKRAPKKNDILFYQRQDGSYILHRVWEVTDTGLTLVGDNQRMLEYGVTEEQIIGYVTRIYRGEKEINCDGLWYRMYLWLWQFMVIRRLVLPVTNRLFNIMKGGRFQ